MLLALKEGRLSFRALVHALRKTAHTTAIILLIILAAHIFGYYFTLEMVTNELITWVGQLDMPPIAIMALILLVYVIFAFFMDQMAILVLTILVFFTLLLYFF